MRAVFRAECRLPRGLGFGRGQAAFGLGDAVEEAWAIASLSVMRCSEPGRAPSCRSRQRVAKGLASPLWLLMTCARPPQTRKAIAAFSTWPRSSTKAASSMMARSPGRPLERKARGAEVMARISWPEAKAMRKT